MVRFDPTRQDLAPYGFSCKRWAPVCMRRPDRHNEIELNLLTEGWITYLFGGRRLRVGAGQLTAFWAAIPHQIVDHGGQADYHVLTLPLGWFLRLRLDEQFVQALLRGQMISMPPQAHTRFEAARLGDWERDFEAGPPATCTAALLEIEAQLRRMALACTGNGNETGQAGPRAVVHEGTLAKAEQLAHLVAERYTEEIDAATLAREVNLPQKNALKLFHLVFGTSLTTYITQYRMSQAQRLLVSSEMSILDISEASGFGSLSRFNRAFRQMCNTSPRLYRKLHASHSGETS